MSTSNKPIVLCVDDDESIRFLIQTILNNQGLETICVESGIQALKMIEKTPPQLVLLDANMPEMNGFEVVEKLKAQEKTKHLPIIMITAYNEERHQARAFLLQVSDFISKPIKNHILIEKIQQHILTSLSDYTTITNYASREKSVVVWNKNALKEAFEGFKSFLNIKLNLSQAQQDLLKTCKVRDIYDCLDIDPEKIAQCIAIFFHLEYTTNITSDKIKPNVLTTAFCQENNIVSVKNVKNRQAFVLSNPFCWDLFDSLKSILKNKEESQFFITNPKYLQELLISPKKTSGFNLNKVKVLDLEEQLKGRYAKANYSSLEAIKEDSEPIILLVNKIIQEAWEARASDIHIEPWEDRVVIRFRVDGSLYVAYQLTEHNLIRPLIARIKIMSELDITEKRLPQDGRIVFKNYLKTAGNFDLRVATTPTPFGEKVVLRLLNKSKSILPLSDLGFSKKNLGNFVRMLSLPYGMILVVGPTGSGKSMTLYTALNQILSPEINIQTIENPIEYSLPGVTQVQTNPKIGLTFSNTLRCFLRQDPDIILVGEIRDLETAEIAVEASLTGHLLLSTLHTNDATSTVMRLIEMGIESYTLSSSLAMVCAQRLLRRLCSYCKESYFPDSREKELLGLPSNSNIRLYRPKGCKECRGKGFKGRIATHELLIPNDEFRSVVSKKEVHLHALKLVAIDKCQMTTLYWDAVDKVRQGICSLADVLAKIRHSEFDTCPNWMKEEETVSNAHQSQELTAIMPQRPKENPHAKLQKELEQLRKNYVLGLPDRLESIKVQWNKLLKIWHTDTLLKIYHQVHNLTGSGASYDFDLITLKAHSLENFLKTLTDVPDEEHQKTFHSFFQALYDVCYQAIDDTEISSFDTKEEVSKV